MAWVHFDVIFLPDIDEKDPRPRLRADSITTTIKTKSPYWNTCTA